MHEEIKNRKKLEELLTPDGFESLRGMLLLFNRESPYFIYSGVVTASLLDYDDPENKISILAINGKHGLITFKRTRQDLIGMFNVCDAFCGHTPETSFLLEK